MSSKEPISRSDVAGGSGSFIGEVPRIAGEQGKQESKSLGSPRFLLGMPCLVAKFWRMRKGEPTMKVLKFVGCTRVVLCTAPQTDALCDRST